jgi:hypothetical protein
MPFINLSPELGSKNARNDSSAIFLAENAAELSRWLNDSAGFAASITQQGELLFTVGSDQGSREVWRPIL